MSYIVFTFLGAFLGVAIFRLAALLFIKLCEIKEKQLNDLEE